MLSEAYEPQPLHGKQMLSRSPDPPEGFLKESLVTLLKGFLNRVWGWGLDIRRVPLRLIQGSLKGLVFSSIGKSSNQVRQPSIVLMYEPDKLE